MISYRLAGDEPARKQKIGTKIQQRPAAAGELSESDRRRVDDDGG